MRKALKLSYIALILLFLYAPILVLTLYSFVPSNVVSFGDLKNGLSLELYKELFTSEALMTIVRDTLLLALGSAVLATLLGTLGAIGIFYSRSKFGKGVNMASQIPVINAEIVTAVALVLLMTLVFSQSRSVASMLIGHMVLSTPFVVLSVIPKLKQMDPNLYEASLDLGATPFRALWTVVIPEIKSGIFSGFMLAITLSLDDYIISAYTQPAGVKTISTYVYGAMAKSGTNSSLPALRALSAIIFAVIILIVVLKNLIVKEEQK